MQKKLQGKSFKALCSSNQLIVKEEFIKKSRALLDLPTKEIEIE